ncbi:plasmid pRiA4b ORF-3 family protein [Pseudoclavibacter sp. CFCC 11306]|uniref:plasmid pRiA4b ORF-3 family protein n=1 Tax=Pseudoclavibacter sp. CFCC 11306 TaxID=1564493 RepID=UPI001300DF4C|nr:plasmid pRiA4b ORF-3 family protein [Pseudoclavibacter sp. CFCC 11306]KAB1656995.1 plasmid pRiA4b ORF-3 family protein [Pseudoclavibacter sp. CFCC 11306]
MTAADAENGPDKENDPDRSDRDLQQRFAALVGQFSAEEALQLLNEIDEPQPDTILSELTEQRPSLRRPRLARPAMLRIRVDLDLDIDTSPDATVANSVKSTSATQPTPHERQIWRRLDLRSDLTLDQVHQILQAAFAWQDTHLHRFALGGSPLSQGVEPFICEYDLEEGDAEGTPEASVHLDEALQQPGDRLFYVYDYGDHWQVTLRLERVVELSETPGASTADAPAATCVDGRRAAPLENTRGLVTAGDPSAFAERAPDRFSVAEVNASIDLLAARRLEHLGATVQRLVRLAPASIAEETLHRAQIVDGLLRAHDGAAGAGAASTDDAQRDPLFAAAFAPIMAVLDLIGNDGAELTEAGRLRPRIVSAVAQLLPSCDGWPGSATREDSTPPVANLRTLLQRLGLLYVRGGRLLLSRAGRQARTDAAVFVTALRARLGAETLDDPREFIRLLYLLHVAAEGREPEMRLIAAEMTAFGWRTASGGGVDESALYADVSSYVTLFANLGDVRETREKRLAPRAEPAGHSRISPAAAALAAELLRG